MKEVRDLRSERTAIYPPGVVPINKITYGSFGAMLSEAFSFKRFNPDGKEGVEFNGGSVEIGGHEVIVLALKFDDRRVVLGIEGTAEDADVVASSVAEVMFQGENDEPEPDVVAFGTGCTAQLDFDWERLYSPGLLAFLEANALPSAGEPRIVGSVTQFQLKYQTPMELEDRAVTLSPKNFVIGPEGRRPLSDRRYLSSSPTRSDVHLRQLELLEELLKED